MERVKNINKNWLIVSAIAIFVFVVFLQTLQNDFISWDDDHYLLNNQNYRGLGIENIKWTFTESYKSIGMYIPLTWLTWSVDYIFWGMNPFGYHLTNILIHSLSAGAMYFLSYWLLNLVFKDKAKGTQLRIGSVFSAMIWAIHPLRVESVAWITERKDVLCGLFFILTLITYIYYCETNKRKWYWHSLGFSLLALLSKPIAVVIPPVLLLLDYYPLKRLGGDVKFWGKEARKKYYEKVPFAVLSLAVSVFTFSANYHLVGSTLASTTSLSIGDRFLVMSYGPRFYIEKLFLPLNLSPLYELWGKIEVLRGRYIIEYLVALIMVILILSMRKRFPAIYYSSLFFLITLFPVSGIMQAGHQIVADRFTYIPSMGLSLILGGFMASILSSDYYKIIYIKKATLVMAVVVLVILVGLTRKQEKLWINSKTLWEHAIFVSPDSSYAHFQVGEEWYQEGRVNEAMEHYKIAFSLSPHRKEAYLNIANRFSKYNMFAEAEWLYKSLIQTYPSFEFAWLSLGGTYFNAGYPNKAIEIYEQALQIDPGFSLIKEDLEKVKNARNFLK